VVVGLQKKEEKQKSRWDFPATRLDQIWNVVTYQNLDLRCWLR